MVAAPIGMPFLGFVCLPFMDLYGPITYKATTPVCTVALMKPVCLDILGMPKSLCCTALLCIEAHLQDIASADEPCLP